MQRCEISNNYNGLEISILEFFHTEFKCPSPFFLFTEVVSNSTADRQTQTYLTDWSQQASIWQKGHVGMCLKPQFYDHALKHLGHKTSRISPADVLELFEDMTWPMGVCVPRFGESLREK